MLAKFSTKGTCTAPWLHFTCSPPMDDPTERNKNPQEAPFSSSPHREPNTASEAPSPEPSSRLGQSWFQQLREWSPSLVLENTGSVGGVISSAETEGIGKDWINAIKLSDFVVSLKTLEAFRAV